MSPSRLPNYVLFAMAIILAILGASLCGAGLAWLTVCILPYLFSAVAVVVGCVIAGYLISEATRPQMGGCFA